MIVRSLQLRNFRNYATLDLSLGGGVVGVVGDNAQGKTNLVEALVVLSTLKSFRGVANDAVVRDGAEAAVLRADLVHDDGREFLIEIELKREGRSTVQINRKRAARTRDLLTALRTSVFMPEDLYLIRGRRQNDARSWMMRSSPSTQHDTIWSARSSAWCDSGIRCSKTSVRGPVRTRWQVSMRGMTNLPPSATNSVEREQRWSTTLLRECKLRMPHWLVTACR